MKKYVSFERLWFKSTFPSQSHSAYEDALFDLEDTRFELDVMINRLDSLIQTFKTVIRNKERNSRHVFEAVILFKLFACRFRIK